MSTPSVCDRNGFGGARHPRPGRSNERPARTFVGRSHEIAVLRAAYREAAAGATRTVLIGGEPGIGKTRLVEELARDVEGDGAKVLWGRCWTGGGAPPYWPWAQLMRVCLRTDDPTLHAAEVERSAAYLALIAPELQGLLPSLSATSLPLQHARTDARAVLVDSLATLFRELAARVPLVLVFDDLHDADRPSLRLLDFLSRELRDAPVLIIGTYRDAEADCLPEVAHLIGEIACRGATLQLDGLDEALVSDFVRDWLGEPMTADRVRNLHRASGGNPFFLGELLRLLEPDATPDGTVQRGAAELRIPDGVRHAIRRRLESLPRPLRELLVLAAVIGSRFDLEVLARASAESASVEPLLEDLQRAGLVKVDTRTPHRWGFAHDLVREALYEELSASARMALHRRVGEAFETLPHHVVEARIAEVAHHFGLAVPDAAAEKAIDYAARAAAQASRQLAHEEAAAQLARAVELLDACPIANERRRAELLLSLGEAHAKAGETARARLAFLTAAEVARRLAAGDLLARAALGYAGRWIVAGVVDEATVALLEEALASLSAEPSPARATVLGRLAMERYYGSHSRHESEVLSQQAVAMARTAGDPAALAYTLHCRHTSLWGPGQSEDPVDVGAEINRLGRAAGDGELALWGHVWRVLGLLEQARIEDWDAEIQAAARRAEELRLPSFRWWATLYRAARAHLDGRFEAAEQLALEALAVGERLCDPNAALYFGVQLFSLRWDQGRLAELAGTVDGFMAHYPALPAWRAAHALVLSATGSFDAARDELAALAVDRFSGLPRDVNWMTAMAALAETCVALGDARRAAILYELLAPYASRLVVTGNAIACRGAVGHYLGCLAATMQRDEPACRHLADALALHVCMRAQPFVARTQLAYASALDARGRADDRERARAHRAEALETARRLGMRALLAEDDDGERNLFRADGPYWVVAYRGNLLRLEATTGLAYVAALLRRPHRSVHVLELSDEVAGSAAACVRAGQRRLLESLRDQHDEATHNNDLARATALRCEMNQLAEALAPHDRSTELARQRVTKAIRAALAHIAASHPALGHHLGTTIRTGNFCGYHPDPTRPVSWAL